MANAVRDFYQFQVSSCNRLENYMSSCIFLLRLEGPCNSVKNSLKGQEKQGRKWEEMKKQNQF